MKKIWQILTKIFFTSLLISIQIYQVLKKQIKIEIDIIFFFKLHIYGCSFNSLLHHNFCFPLSSQFLHFGGIQSSR